MNTVTVFLRQPMADAELLALLRSQAREVEEVGGDGGQLFVASEAARLYVRSRAPDEYDLERTRDLPALAALLHEARGPPVYLSRSTAFTATRAELLSDESIVACF